MSYFGKCHKLRAVTVFPNILALAAKYGLSLDEKELRGAPKDNRPVIPEMADKEQNWLKHPEDSIYYAHLKHLTDDAPKLKVIRSIIDRLGTDIHGRPEKLVIFTSSPIVSWGRPRANALSI